MISRKANNYTEAINNCMLVLILMFVA